MFLESVAGSPRNTHAKPHFEGYSADRAKAGGSEKPQSRNIVGADVGYNLLDAKVERKGE